MLMAGKILLLTLLFLAVSKVPAQAQESLGLLTMQASSSKACTSLQSYFILEGEKCREEKLSQKELVIKAAVNKVEKEDKPIFSHSTESIYYEEAAITPLVAETVSQPIVTEIPTVTPATNAQIPQDMVPATGNNIDSNLIFDLINSHRASIGKPAFLKDDALCSLAQVRSVELYGELFGNAGYLHSGLYNRGLPYWITENAKWGSNEAGTVQWWLNSPIHRSAIDGDHVYSCGACQGSQCSQLFTSYSPKV